LAVWLTANSIFTMSVPGFPTVVQAAMLCHRNLGAAFVGLLVVCYPAHLFAFKGFSRATVSLIFSPIKPIVFVIGAYCLVSRSWEINRYLSLAATALVFAAFEIVAKRRRLWRRCVDALLVIALAQAFPASPFDELIRFFVFSLVFLSVWRLGSAFVSIVAKPLQRTAASGVLLFYATALSLVFAAMMLGGANAGNYDMFTDAEYSPFDWYHRLASFLWLGAAATHVWIAWGSSDRRGPTRRIVDWRIVLAFVPICFVAEIAHYYHYSAFRTAAPSAPAPAIVSPYSNLKGYVAAGRNLWFMTTINTCSAYRCHPEIAEQHDRSAHGRAFENAAFKTELAKFIQDRGRPAADYCLSCHAPLGVIAHPAAGAGDGAIDPLTTKDPAFAAGVACVVCHRAAADQSGPVGNASLAIRPLWLDRERYLGEDEEAGQPLHRTLIQAAIGLHRQEMRVKKEDWNAVCGACHVVTLPASLAADGVEKPIADHYLSYLKSDFAKKGVTCADCHQPRFETREIGYITSAHDYLGPGASLPYGDKWDEPFRRISLAFLTGLGDVALRAAATDDLPPCVADAPRKKRHVLFERGPRDPFIGTNGGCAFRGLLKTDLTVRGIFSDRVDIDVTTSNECVGHAFPAGGGMRAYLEVTALDANGAVVGSYGGLGADGKPVDTPSILGNRSVDRDGRPIADRRFWNMVAVVREKRLPVGGSTRDHVELALARNGGAPRTIQAQWWYLRPEALRMGVQGTSEETAPVLVGKAVATLAK